MADRAVSPAGELYQCNSCERMLGANDFYASNLSNCKKCVKRRVRENRAEKIDYYRMYDRKRYRASDERKAAARRSANSPAGLRAKARSLAKIKADNPEKVAARNAVHNAIRDGRLERGEECFFCGCGGKLHAHHHDYSLPLDVFWLCPSCHGKLHTINGDFLREGRA